MHSLINLLLLIMFTAFSAAAQQQQDSKPYSPPAQLNASVNFTYKVFQAPNKMCGYDIFKNDKIVFHQPASFITPNNSLGAFTKREHAEKAASLAIEKLKKGESATLTHEEIKNIISI
jgi:hypothetical protein